MSYFSSNLKILRAYHTLSQQALAERILISRANIAKYEGAIHEPSFEILIRMARYFKVSLDMLLTVDMTMMGKEEIEKLSDNSNVIFPIQVDQNGKDVIEVVPHNAQAGYTGMYGDVGYIESLDHMELPFLSHYGKCRAFPISGDSMPPYGDGSYVIGKYISSRNDIKDAQRYILLSRDEGIVFKRVYLPANDQNSIMLHSDNPNFKPYEMSWNQVVEIWEFVAAVTLKESSEDYLVTDMFSRIQELQDDLKVFSKRFGTN